MFQALVAFLTVMSGYVFVSTWHRTRYLLLRQPPQRVYFRAAFWGFWLFILSVAIALLIRDCFAGGWGEFWIAIAPLLPDVGVGSAVLITELAAVALVICLILGLVGGYGLNWLELFRRWPDDWRLSLLTTLESGTGVVKALYGLTSRRPLRRAVEYLNADLERILLRALREEQPLCMTMSDRKVYIGFLCGAVDPSDVNDMVRILPYMSGFRSSESLELVITDYYDELYAHRDNGEASTNTPVIDSTPSSSRNGQSDFEVALPIRDIRSCRLFDTALYLMYQQERNSNVTNFLHPLSDSVAAI